MAKILGGIASGLTIAALFRTSFEALDIIETSRSQDADYRRLRLRLDIEKCRLYNWGESMGLTDIMEIDPQYSDQDLRFPQAVRNILEDLFRLFYDTERVKDKYGYRQATRQDREADYIQTRNFGPLGALPQNLEMPSEVSQMTRIKQNITWVMNDRRKFTLLVAEIKELIDKLKEITAPEVALAVADQGAAKQIKNIRDTEALALVAELCSVDHADIVRLRQQRSVYSSQRQSNEQKGSTDLINITPSSVMRTPRYEMAKL